MQQTATPTEQSELQAAVEAETVSTTPALTPTSLPVISLDETQQQGVAACCDISNRVVGITGQPGTGKTTILRATYEHLTDAGYTVALCAPTGKAAKRITEATGIPAVTLHRLLEYSHPGELDPKTGKPRFFSWPKRNIDNRLDVDVVICDEYSMVAKENHRALFDALKHSAVVRVFGDANQLQPIEQNAYNAESASPFVQMLDKFPSVRLETIHRQGKGSGIVINAQAMLKGRMPTRHDDFSIIITDDPVTRLRSIIDKTLGRTSFALLDNQIITPMKKSWVGTVKLNALLQSIYQIATPDDAWLDVPRHSWAKDLGTRFCVGDKVINISNNYHLNCFNGETGIIQEISEYGEIVIDFGDRSITYPPAIMVMSRAGQMVEVDPRKDLELAYALTTHKAQGSEYKNVIYMLNKSVRFGSSRENIYTGITRARFGVVVISDSNTLSYAVNTTEEKKKKAIDDWKRRQSKK